VVIAEFMRDNAIHHLRVPARAHYFTNTADGIA
jgi:hypothetical protein